VTAPRDNLTPAPALADSPLLLGVEEGYQRWAPYYDGAPNPLIAREERYIAPLLLPSLRGKRVLDLACGTGRWLQKAQMAGAEFAAGVDCSPAMLSIAAGKHSIHAKLALADCTKLPFGPVAFDFAICSFAIGHIEDLRMMVRELTSVMKPGGEVFVSDVHPEAYARGWRTGFRDVLGALQIEVVPRMTEEIIRAFYSGGFECLTYVSLCLGEAERPIFVSANKEHTFEKATRVPAVLVCHFKQRNPPRRELK
jgi:ubiquinone/menaquinone biosynthesis C-methylase UbiE